MMTWAAQRALADRFTLVVPTRTGYAPNPPLDRIDFDVQSGEIADLIEPGDHLVGHSYGGVVSMLAAARRTDALRSLTVVEPPAFGVARGDPDVEAFLGTVRRTPRDPVEYLRFFLPLVGSSAAMPEPVPEWLELGGRAALAERPPDEAVIPLDELRDAAFPRLVVSGAHSAAFDAVCDVLERELEAERVVVPGAGHSVPRTGEPFNRALVDFLSRT